jgi:hypothetical protein
MNLYNDGGPAFPLKRDPELRPIGGATLQTAAPITPQFDNRDQLGMSLRDYFAAKALCGPVQWDYMQAAKRGEEMTSEHMAHLMRVRLGQHGAHRAG